MYVVLFTAWKSSLNVCVSACVCMKHAGGQMELTTQSDWWDR